MLDYHPPKRQPCTCSPTGRLGCQRATNILNGFQEPALFLPAGAELMVDLGYVKSGGILQQGLLEKGDRRSDYASLFKAKRLDAKILCPVKGIPRASQACTKGLLVGWRPARSAIPGVSVGRQGQVRLTFELRRRRR